MDIICKNLRFEYNKNTEFKVVALNNVTLTIKEGEFFGIIGHTGSGKSTFVQHLNALIPLDEGELKIGEYDLSLQKAKKRKDRAAIKAKLKSLRRDVGMVFQYPEYQLFAETVRDDVAFGIKNFMPELSESEVDIYVKNAIETVGLDYNEIKDRSPFDLSGGQKRRVAIAGVIAVRPKILILDEPCAGLDPQGKSELWALLKRLHETSIKTIIIVSHDMNDVADHCTKAVIFERGAVKKIGTPKELFSVHSLIEDCGLEVPVTAYLQEELSLRGVNIDTDYSLDDFSEKLIAYLKSVKSEKI